MAKDFVLITLALAATIGADVGFYGYRRLAHNDTTWVYSQQYLGSVTLERSVLTLTPKGGYIDVVEDAWLSGNVSGFQYGDLTQNFVLSGTFQLPEQAAVTGAMTWVDGKPYRARLKPSTYDFSQQFRDSTALESYIRNHIIRIQQISERSYSVAFSSMSLGEQRHVRIRYLLPNLAGGQARYAVPVLFHSRSGAPGNLRVHLRVPPDSPYEVRTPTGNIRVDDSISLAMPYSSTLELNRVDSNKVFYHYADFPAGEWRGEYLSVDMTVTDSLIDALSRKMQVMLLWRWNGSPLFVDYGMQGLLDLTHQGRKLVEQARELHRLARKLTDKGYATGLVYSTETGTGQVFPPSDSGSADFRQLESFLTGFSAEAVYRSFADDIKRDPDWLPVVQEGVGRYESESRAFKKALQEAQDLFSEDSSLHRHMLLVSLGDASFHYAQWGDHTLDSILRGATLDVHDAAWTGVPLGAIVPSASDQKLTIWEGHRFPFFRPKTFKLGVGHAGQPFAFPVAAQNGESFHVRMKSDAPFDSALLISGFDGAGLFTRDTLISPRILQAGIDTGLAKIWAKDGDRMSIREEEQLGARYGFVTKATYLGASLEDSLANAPDGIPHLSFDEIDIEIHGTPIIPKELMASRSWARMGADGLRLFLPGLGRALEIEIYDATGRLVQRIEMGKWLQDGRWLLLSRDHLDIPRGPFLLRVKGSAASITFKVKMV